VLGPLERCSLVFLQASVPGLSDAAVDGVQVASIYHRDAAAADDDDDCDVLCHLVAADCEVLCQRVAGVMTSGRTLTIHPPAPWSLVSGDWLSNQHTLTQFTQSIVITRAVEIND